LQTLLKGGIHMHENNSKTSFLISSFLLQYPNAEWMENVEEVLKETEKIQQQSCCKPLFRFLQYAQRTKELDLAELYVRTFDYTKNTNLYLTYYEYKEDRKRGEALLNLKKRYREAGINLSSEELPDFFPVVLEFTAITGAQDVLMSHRAVIKNIYEKLSKDNNPYSLVMEAVLLLLKEASSYKQESAEVLGGVLE
jgi:nitrate reductase molybdenum cofactor assembly chaperone NarJ/NarW